VREAQTCPIPAPSVRKKPKVRFRKPLSILQLTATSSALPHHQARHRLGLGYHSPAPQQNPLPFFSLLPNFTTHHPPHNREVCTANRAARYIYNRIIELWQTHRPTMAGAWVTTHLLQSVGVFTAWQRCTQARHGLLVPTPKPPARCERGIVPSQNIRHRFH
jgi:hypothetical protein